MVVNQFKAAGVLCLLYFLQGIPYGIQVKSMPIYYYDILKFPIENVTKLSLLMTPWIFLKPLAICFIDFQTKSRYILIFSILAIACLNIILYFLFLSNSAMYYFMHLLVFFCINCLTVLLDITTDQLAIVSAGSSNDIKFLGISNSIQIVSYKFGAFFSVFVLHIFSYENISNMFILLSLLHLIVFVFLICTDFVKTVGNHKTSDISDSKQTITFFKIINKTFSSSCNLLLLVYIFTYKLGEIGASTVLPLHLLESGVDRSYVTYLSTVISEPLSLAGSLLGGLMWTWQKGSTAETLLKMLLLMSVFRSLPLFLQWLAFSPSLLWKYNLFELSSASLPILSFIGGVVSTFTFTLMMMLACITGRISYASYCYSLFSCVEVFGKLLFSSYAGYLSNMLGKVNSYAFFCFANFVTAGFVFLLKQYLYFEISEKND